MIIYQLVTGRKAFVREERLKNPFLTPPLPSKVKPAVPLAIERIIMTALAPEPQMRFQSMPEMKKELEHAAATLK